MAEKIWEVVASWNLEYHRPTLFRIYNCFFIHQKLLSFVFETINFIRVVRVLWLNKFESSFYFANIFQVLFDKNGCIQRYSNVEQILRDFFDLRKEYYVKRKNFLEGMLAAESLKLDNIARFILEKIDGIVVIGTCWPFWNNFLVNVLTNISIFLWMVLKMYK